MKTLHDESTRREVGERIASLSPDSAALWGTMSAPRMVVHLADSLRMATGDLVCRSKRLPIRYTPLKQIIIYLAPFPKGAPTAPELLRRTPAEWAADVADLHTMMAKYASLSARVEWPEHPAFGRLDRRGWGVLTYRHSDHHLRQFGA